MPRGVEVLLASGVQDRVDPPLAGVPVNGRDLQALIGEPLQVEAPRAVVPRADCRVEIAWKGPFAVSFGHHWTPSMLIQPGRPLVPTNVPTSSPDLFELDP
jgi:hypothetical protein